MKVVAYNIKNFEKEPLAKFNQRKHDITLISDRLNEDTIQYAVGKQAVLLSQEDASNMSIIQRLSSIGIRYLILLSSKTTLSENDTSKQRIISKIFPYCKKEGSENPEIVKGMAEFTVNCLDQWQSESSSLIPGI